MPEPNAFTGAPLDRVPDGRKDPGWVAARRADPAARALLAGDAGIHVTGDDPPRLARVALDAAARGGEPLLLGVDDGGPLFVVDTEPGGAAPRPLVGARADAPAPGRERSGDEGEARGRRTRPAGLRDVVAGLPREEGGLVAYACALVNWHRRHGCCSACGAPTDVISGGLARECPRCGTHHFPRTDPVVIMAVHDGRERLLLGRQPSWPAQRYSTLAGFVEPGETLEEAVAREVREEAGVEIEPPRYASSQPWPFPGSLMLGFHAQWHAGEPRRQEDEMEDVRWFSRAAVEAAVRGEGRLGLPDRYAIARRLIEGWLAI